VLDTSTERLVGAEQGCASRHKDSARIMAKAWVPTRGEMGRSDRAMRCGERVSPPSVGRESVRCEKCIRRANRARRRGRRRRLTGASSASKLGSFPRASRWSPIMSLRTRIECVVCASSLASAQTTLWQYKGTPNNAECGLAIASTPDIDGDGGRELIVTENIWVGTSMLRRIDVLSGATGRRVALPTATHPTGGDRATWLGCEFGRGRTRYSVRRRLESNDGIVAPLTADPRLRER
jgi:hypothetical protein